MHTSPFRQTPIKTIAKRMGVEKIQEITCYIFTGPAGIDRLDFIPSQSTPGFSHRVAYNGVLTRTYLGSDWPLNQRTALDMLDILRKTQMKGVA